MKVFYYHGTYSQFTNQRCIITHIFVNCYDKIKFFGDGRPDDDEKYQVLFKDGHTTNVFGRNLKYACSDFSGHEEGIFMSYLGDFPENEEPEEHPYVSVVFKDTPHKSYSYLNKGLKLKRGQKVCVEARGYYGIAMVVGFLDKCSDGAKKACKYIVQVIDTDRIDKMRDAERRKKELKHLIDIRVKLLRDKIEILQLSEQDDELAELLKEYNA